MPIINLTPLPSALSTGTMVPNGNNRDYNAWKVTMSNRGRSVHAKLPATTGECRAIRQAGMVHKVRDEIGSKRIKRGICLCPMATGSSFYFPGLQIPHLKMGLILHKIVLRAK